MAQVNDPFSTVRNRRKEGRIGPREYKNPPRQTLNPVTAACSIQGTWWTDSSPKSLGSPSSMVSLAMAHVTSLLGWLRSLPAAFLGGYFLSLASLSSWGLHCSFGFALTASHPVCSGTTHRSSYLPHIAWLAGLPLESWKKQPWPVTFVLCMPTKSASWGWLQL